MTGFIDRIVIDVDDLHALHGSIPLRPLHGNQITVFHGYALRIRCLEYGITIPHIRRHAICQNIDVIALAFYRQLVMRQ